VIVSNISVGGGPGDLPTENVSLAYGSIAYSYPAAGETAPAVRHDLTRGIVA
jgi:type VI secretion system secreted protein Hcp